MNKYIFMTYDSNGTPLNEDLRKYTKDSLVFDRSRRSIYAQELEYGYVGIRGIYQPANGVNSYQYPVTFLYRDDENDCHITFTYSDIALRLGDYTQETSIGDTNLHKSYIVSPRTAKHVITSIQQNSLGKITYTYDYIATTHGTEPGVELRGSNPNQYPSWVPSDYKKQMDNQSYLSTASNKLYNFLYSYLSDDGILSYTYYDATVKYGLLSRSEEYTITNSSTLNVVLGITQDSKGQISYTYGTINTTHDNVPMLVENGSHVITNIRINANGLLSYQYEIITQKSEYKENQNGIYSNPKNEIKLSYSRGTYVISNISQSNTGEISYTYSYLHTYHYGAKTGDFITGVSLSHDGVLSGTAGTFATNNGTFDPKTGTEYFGGLTYITGLSIGSNGHISYTYSYTHFPNTQDEINTTKQKITKDGVYVVNGVHIDNKGNFSYNIQKIYVGNSDESETLTYLYGKDVIPGTYTHVITNIYKDANNHNRLTFTRTDLSVTSGYVTTSPKVVNANQVKVPTSAATAFSVLTGIKESGDGQITYTYSNIYTDPAADYRYHNLMITAQTATGDANFTYPIVGISTDNSGNATAHNITYAISGVPTKKYVDDLIQANDAMRYCGTVAPSAAASGAITLTHTANPGPAHGTTPDTSCGAVYKVSANGYIGTTYVSPGDMIISYQDNASSNSATGWNVINENINLTNSGTLSYNSGTNNDVVVTNVYLTNSGTLAYTYSRIQHSNNVPTGMNVAVKTKYSGINGTDILVNQTTNNTGIPVITGVSLSHNGTYIGLSYSYTYTYVSQRHHSTNTGSKASNATFSISYSNVLTGVAISADGTLSYTYTPFNVTDSSHANESEYAEQAYLSYGLNSVELAGSTTSGVLTNIYVNTASNKPNKLTVSYTNLTGSQDASSGFVYGYVQSSTGKISIHTRNFANTKNTGTKYMSNTSADFVTAVGLGTDGKLTYTITTVTITDSYTNNVADTSKLYLTGAKAAGRSYSYYTANTYTTNGAFYTSSAKIGGETIVKGNFTAQSHSYLQSNSYIGNLAAHGVFLRSKKIYLDENTTAVEFTGLQYLWGTI